MINPVSNALAGMTSAAKKLDTAASNIASASNEGSAINLDQELINTLKAKQDYQANAMMMKRVRELGELFDEIV